MLYNSLTMDLCMWTIWEICRSIVCWAQTEDEAPDMNKMAEERQKLLNDIERLRAENDSLKVSTV